MNLMELLKLITTKLSENNIQFALAGGLVASLYRSQVRATNDIDLVLFASSDLQSQAMRILKESNFSVSILRKADLEGGPLFAIKKKSTPVVMIVGRPQTKSAIEYGVDFLLPSIPWAKQAVERAQNNKICFGFKPIPCISIEDFIISKLYSLKNMQTRFKDMDDLMNVFSSKIEIDIIYFVSQFELLKLSIPKELKNFIPEKLTRALKI